MAALTVRNLPAEVHRAIRVRAEAHGRSTKAEVREILAQAVQSNGSLRLGTELRRYAEQFGGVDLEPRRDTAPIAAIAQSHGFAVATRDAKPFCAAGIEVMNPSEYSSAV